MKKEAIDIVFGPIQGVYHNDDSTTAFDFSFKHADSKNVSNLLSLCSALGVTLEDIAENAKDEIRIHVFNKDRILPVSTTGEIKRETHIKGIFVASMAFDAIPGLGCTLEKALKSLVLIKELI